MPSNDDKPSSSEPEVVTPTYSGPDRRKNDSDDDQRLRKRVRFDDRGNPVWELRVDDVPRRRKDDSTVDLLKCLDPDSLSLVDDDDDEPA